MDAIKIAHRWSWLMVPTIALGGLWYPWLGLLMLPMMIFLLGLSYFRGRYWCGNLCPRGSLLENIIRPMSSAKMIPPMLISNRWRYTVLAVFIGVFSYRTYNVFSALSGWDAWMRFGYLFATLCLWTSIIAITLGIYYNPRTWCSFCPMGTLQNEIHKRGKGHNGI